MNLKESYRYANYLDGLLSTAYTYLRNKGFVTTTVEEHLRKQSNPDVENETIEVQKSFDVEFSPNDVIDFVVKVIEEKEKLYESIAKAKGTTEINIDNAISMNKKKQGFVSVLNGIADIKPTESITTGNDYKFNNEGNQVKYFYNIKRITTIDYNRTDIKNLIKKYLRETDDISAKLDLIEITTIVQFTPLFNINTSFEDSIVEYIDRKDK